MASFIERLRRWRNSRRGSHIEEGLSPLSVEQVARSVYDVSRANGERQLNFDLRMDAAVRQRLLAGVRIHSALEASDVFSEYGPGRWLISNSRVYRRRTSRVFSIKLIPSPRTGTMNVGIEPEILSVCEMNTLVGIMCGRENIGHDIYQKFIMAFSNPGTVEYRLHIDPNEMTCDVYINEEHIIKLKGNDTNDPQHLGNKFLTLVNRRMFGSGIIRID